MQHSAVIIGATGGIGGAIADALELSQDYKRVWRFSRTGGDASLDLTDEASIAAAAMVASDGPPPGLIVVATGLLHHPDRGPEKALKELDAAWMARNFAINTIGPALIAKHFARLLPADHRSVMAFLSARVGSISDNQLGGWYGYRASKAALNMLVRTLSVELGRTKKQTICVALHPGTVDTGLSKPFQRNVVAGKLFSPQQSAGHLIAVISGLNQSDSGKLFAWDGQEILP